MRVALDAARSAIASGDIPVGAAIFNSKGEVVAIGHSWHHPAWRTPR